MKSLYAYFGLLDLHEVDSPGHSFYQLGLLDQIKYNFMDDDAQFDFFSYYPEVLQTGQFPKYPNTALGEVFNRYAASLLNQYCIPFTNMIDAIENREYDTLFLKARFRNLSTLTKKWKDTHIFETIIEKALNAGYTKDKIVVLDTDMSLSQDFSERYSKYCTIQLANVACSERFILDCASVHMSSIDDRKTTSVFYGNVDTSNYKAGNEKSKILTEILVRTTDFSDLSIIVKEGSVPIKSEDIEYIARNNRSHIWETLENSRIMINVSKDKYDSEKFIPARVYEALIFGMIPVSYKFEWLCETFSFSNELDYIEILKYLIEIDSEDFKKAYKFYINKFIENVYGT